MESGLIPTSGHSPHWRDHLSSHTCTSLSFNLLIFRDPHIILFHLLMHSLVGSCMCSDPGSNPQSWHIRMTP